MTRRLQATATIKLFDYIDKAYVNAHPITLSIYV